MQSWYIVVVIFKVIFTQFGPFETKEECLKKMVEYRSEAVERYNNGERMSFMGFDVKPGAVKAQCKLK